MAILKSNKVIYCAGLSPLINICSHPNIADHEIHYINFKQLSYETMDFGTELELVKKICNLANVKKVYGTQLKIFPGNKFGKKIKIEQPKIQFKNFDLFSYNLIPPLIPVLKGKKINSFSEGASALNVLFPPKNKSLTVKYKQRIKGILRSLNYLIPLFPMVEKTLVFDGKAFSIKDKIDLPSNYELLEFNNLFNFRERLAEMFSSSFAFFKDIKKIKNPILYIPTTEIPFDDYCIFFNDSLKLIPDAKSREFIIKVHPGDGKKYTDFFKKAGLKYYEFSSIIERNIPAEVILTLNEDFEYFGVISTVLMSMSTAKYKLTSAPPKYRNLYKEIYNGLIQLYNIQDILEYYQDINYE